MLDIKFIRENPKVLKQAAKNKGVEIDADKILELDAQRRKILVELEAARAEVNRRVKEKPALKVRKELKKLKEKIKVQQEQEKQIAQELHPLLLELPNIPATDVPIGKDETENVVLRKWGEIPEFGFELKDHLALGEALDIIDSQRAAKVSGSRFAYLKGDGALLEFALVRLAIDTLVAGGFIPIIPPALIKTESMAAMGYMAHGGADDMYILNKDNLVLIGTSEQSIGPMHQDEILKEGQLPLRYAGFSTCFRREAGSWGKDTRGILRVHQFDKVEMFSFATPEQSDEEHEFLLRMEEKLFQGLKIPYQIVKMCSGDLGLPAARKYDIEAWIPSQNRYREVTSTSTTTDFQSRRLNIRYKPIPSLQGPALKFVHMLNGTAFAIGRTIVAILENYQQKDGSIKVPEVLRQYMEGKAKIASSQ